MKFQKDTEHIVLQSKPSKKGFFLAFASVLKDRITKFEQLYYHYYYSWKTFSLLWQLFGDQIVECK